MATTTKSRGKGSTKQHLTAYGAAKLVNEALRSRGIDKRIPPQMMYNYTHARLAEGKRPFIHYTKSRGVDKNDLDRWLAEYLSKQESDTE